MSKGQEGFSRIEREPTDTLIYDAMMGINTQHTFCRSCHKLYCFVWIAASSCNASLTLTYMEKNICGPTKWSINVLCWHHYLHPGLPFLA